MAIGDSMTATPIPAVGESGTSYASKIVAFLTEVKARLEAKVPMSSLLPGAFDLSNNQLSNAKYLGLYEQVSLPTTPVGSFQRYGGEAYYVSPSGAVRITNAGSLDVVSVNGISGDYAAPAEFKYVLADLEYYAYSDTGAAPKKWARVAAQGYDIYGTLQSTTRVRLAWAGGSSYTLTVPTAVPARTLLLQMDSSGNVTPDDTARVLHIPGMMSFSSGMLAIDSGHRVNAGTSTVLYPISLPEGSIISAYKVYLKKNSDGSNSWSARLRKIDDTSSTDTALGSGVSTSANNPGFTSLTESVTETIPAGTGVQHYLKLSFSGLTNNDEAYQVEITYKQR